MRSRIFSTAWSGDGAPADGSLRSFAVGAVIQHFTKRLDRVPDVDFRLPTDEELDALEAEDSRDIAIAEFVPLEAVDPV